MTTAWDDLAAENAFLRRELEARDAGILECQTRMLELERELAERDKTLADIAATDDYQARGRKIKKLKQERDEAQAQIAALERELADLKMALKTSRPGEPEWHTGFRGRDGQTVTVVEGLIDKATYDEAHAAIRALDEAARNLVLAYDAKGEWATSFIRDEVDALRVVLGMVPDPSANAPAIRRASEKE